MRLPKRHEEQAATLFQRQPSRAINPSLVFQGALMRVVSKAFLWSMIVSTILSVASCKASSPDASSTSEPARQPLVAAPVAVPPAVAADSVLSKLSVGMAYGDLRNALLADGWLPLRDPECWDNVGGEAAVCNLLPETESCSADGYCRAQFAKTPDAVLVVTAYGSYKTWDKTATDSVFQVKSFEASRVEKPVAECPPQDFNEFLRRFASDSHVQSAYTAPLVKVAEIEDRGDEGYFSRMVYEKAATYRGFNVAHADNAFHFIDGRGQRDPNPLTLKIDAPTSDRRDVSYLYGMSEGNSYRFEKKGECWVLTEDPKPPTP
jgi:hypothetical protein